MKRNKRELVQFADLNERNQMYGENFHEESSAEDQALIAELLHGFDRMELAIRKPEPPPLHELEKFVAAERQRLRKRAGLEIVLFLIIALVLIGSNLLLVSMNIVVFVAIQGLVFVGAITFVVRFFYRSKKKVKSGHA